ncbi:MAG: DNA-3-methyladenine glycosylase II [Candidatus Amesbacteria bacterium GW2011_GWA2_42_12]|uniref:DNA-3-methyladenine glycosylase II n=1 Tax=Candidatus Amesbacteria bacterium GW2011_GWA2_42_12 TaxID=1618356 RepID=A0A0G0Y2Z8_9BACT|nr:MAG: DNA-3-methyladenine glycosylase II [Candidatus Amesbacteria bacterium GW2011_GWA2_42_12]
MKHIFSHFKTHDPVIHMVMNTYGLEVLEKPAHPDTYFYKLVREIAHQQLAGKAAAAIFSRFEALFPNKNITPKRVVALSHESIRGVGLSNAKARYIRNIAEGVESGLLKLHNLPKMSDEEVVLHLIQIKGIGRWTAEMFLMFTLGREDVFSYGDLGLRNAMKKLYKFRKEPTQERIEKIVKKWVPYKTYASLALWKSLDNK